MLRILGYLLVGWIALVVVLWLFSFVLGLIVKAVFWFSLIGIVALAVMMLRDKRRR